MRKPKKPNKAGADVRSEWGEIINRAPLTISGGRATEPPTGEKKAPKLHASSPTTRKPTAPPPADAVAELAAEYPAGVPLTLPERPWGSSTVRAWASGFALLALLLAFVVVIGFRGAPVHPAFVIPLVAALTLLRSLTIARLEGGLRPEDGARAAVGATVSAAPADPPHDGKPTGSN